jgi:hypothetical protein
LANKKDISEVFKTVFHELYLPNGAIRIHTKRERESKITYPTAPTKPPNNGLKLCQY